LGWLTESLSDDVFMYGAASVTSNNTLSNFIPFSHAFCIASLKAQAIEEEVISPAAFELFSDANNNICDLLST
jgi:hypothetical protein